MGIFASIYHSSEFPLGLLVSLGLIFLAFASVHFLGATRAVSSAVGFGLLGVIAVLSGLDPHGSVMIIADTRGFVLLAGASTITVISVAWPRVGSARSG